MDSRVNKLRNEQSRLKAYGGTVSNDGISTQHMATVPISTAYGKIVGGTLGGVGLGAMAMGAKHGLPHSVLSFADKVKPGNEGIRKARSAVRYISNKSNKAGRKALTGAGNILNRKGYNEAGQFLIDNRKAIVKSVNKAGRIAGTIGLGIGAGKAVGGLVGSFKARKEFQNEYGGKKGSTWRTLKSYAANSLTGKSPEVNAAYDARQASNARLKNDTMLSEKLVKRKDRMKKAKIKALNKAKKKKAAAKKGK